MFTNFNSSFSFLDCDVDHSLLDPFVVWVTFIYVRGRILSTPAPDRPSLEMCRNSPSCSVCINTRANRRSKGPRRAYHPRPRRSHRGVCDRPSERRTASPRAYTPLRLMPVYAHVPARTRDGTRRERLSRETLCEVRHVS